MEKRITEYIKHMRNFVSEEHTLEEYDKAYKDLMIQIAFFQHERLIHLIVTVTFAILTIISLVANMLVYNIALIILSVLFICLLIPYIRHYYILENSVQELYKRYDYLFEILNK